MTALLVRDLAQLATPSGAGAPLRGRELGAVDVVEDAYLLARYVLDINPQATLAIGPVPVMGSDKKFPSGFTVFAEKAPNARGVRRVLRKLSQSVLEYPEFVAALRKPGIDAVLLTGNYPSAWATPPGPARSSCPP